MASNGRLVYRQNGSNKTVNLGIINSINDSINVTVPNFTTPMLKAEQQFGMDSGSTESIDLSLVHVNTEGDGLTNAQWMKALEDAVNRWQAESDGETFNFTPDSGASQYIPSYSTNVYISTLSHTWKAGHPDVIDASLKLSVGSIRGGYSSSYEQIELTNMSVYLVESSKSSWIEKPNWTTYTLCGYINGTWTNLIESMVIKGGMNQPFESLTMKIPRRRLEDAGIDITSFQAISLGYSLIKLDGAMGYGVFVINGADTVDGNYEFTAYSIAEVVSTTYTTHSYGVAPSSTRGDTKGASSTQKMMVYDIATEVDEKKEEEVPLKKSAETPEEPLKEDADSDTGATRGDTKAVGDTYQFQVSVPSNYTDCSVYVYPPYEDVYAGETKTFTATEGTNTRLSAYGTSSYEFSVWFINGLPRSSNNPLTVDTSMSLIEPRFTSVDPYAKMSPRQIILDILAKGFNFNGIKFTWVPSPSGSTDTNIVGAIHWDADTRDWNANYSSSGTYPYFPEGTNVWYILQVCAYMCKAKIHFSDGDCYITSYDFTYASSGATLDTEDMPIVSTPEIGNNTVNKVTNTIIVEYGLPDENGNVEYEGGKVTNSDSIAIYGERGSNLKLPCIGDGVDVSTIASAILGCYSNGGQSVEINLNENMNIRGSDPTKWESQYGSDYRVQEIHDYFNDVNITAKRYRAFSQPNYYATVSMASYERHFPECTCKYVFGPLDNSTLSLKFKQLETNIRKG